MAKEKKVVPEIAPEPNVESAPKRGRGRPKKEETAVLKAGVVNEVKRGRGRPKKGEELNKKTAPKKSNLASAKKAEKVKAPSKKAAAAKKDVLVEKEIPEVAPAIAEQPLDVEPVATTESITVETIAADPMVVETIATETVAEESAPTEVAYEEIAPIEEPTVAPIAPTVAETPGAPVAATGTDYAFLKKYIDTPSPVGFEWNGQKVWLEYLKPYIDLHFADAYGTVVGVVNPGAQFKVVIEAHCDEISWYVNYITPEGLIYVKRNGGSDHQIAPSKRVLIHGKKGGVKAVFGWPAIHTRQTNGDAKEQQPKVENLFLDCGARTKQEVEDLGIHVGAVITYEEGYDELSNGYIIGRALDNRVGGFMIAEVAKKIKENNIKLPYSLYIVNAVQEEIGLRGAEMIARKIKPDVAIITDVTHDTQTPMINKNIEGDVACGKGPSPCYGPAVHNKLLGIVETVAAENKIPLQLRAISRSTGTDTDSFAYANEGCPSVLISLPLRYMHTTVEMAHKSDIESTIELIYQSLLALTPNTDLAYL